jgi:O-methyltransferase involved in polyketide biosynthesis
LGERHAWTWATRAYLFDSYIREQVKEGADTVVNLAAGLDTRPYRMDLPSSLRWVDRPQGERMRVLASRCPKHGPSECLDPARRANRGSP